MCCAHAGDAHGLCSTGCASTATRSGWLQPYAAYAGVAVCQLVFLLSQQLQLQLFAQSQLQVGGQPHGLFGAFSAVCSVFLLFIMDSIWFGFLRARSMLGMVYRVLQHDHNVLVLQ